MNKDSKRTEEIAKLFAAAYAKAMKELSTK